MFILLELMNSFLLFCFLSFIIFLTDEFMGLIEFLTGVRRTVGEKAENKIVE